MFYLSRTGNTEGPFTDVVIADMIRSRLVDDGHVCPVGGSEWTLLSAHPSFQAAIEERRLRESAPPPAVAASAAAPAPPVATPASVRPGSPNAPPLPVRASAVPLPPAHPTPPGGLQAMAMQPQAAPPVSPASMGPMPAAQPAQPMAPNAGPMGPGSMGPMGPGSMGPMGPNAGPMGPGSMGPMAPNAGPMGPGSMSPMPPHVAMAQNGMPYGPPPMGGRPSGGFAGSFSVPPPEPKSKALVIAGAILGVLLLLGGGGAALAYFLVFRSATPLAQYFPEGTEVYAEVANVKGSALSAVQMGFLDASKIDEKKSLEDAQNGFANAFDLSKVDAARVALGIDGIAFGGHDLDKKGAVAIVVTWSDAKAAETLFKSARFNAEGDSEKGGRRYSLKKRDVSFEQKKGMSLLESSLSGLSLKASDKDDQLVWYPKQKVLVLANERGLNEIAPVVDGSQKRTLLAAPAFAAQKSRFGGKGLTAWIDTSVVKGEKAKDVQKYLEGTSPIVLSVGAEKGGVRMTMTGEVAGLDDQLGRLEGWLDAPGLTLGKRLPKETVGYLAFSSRSKLSGKDARDAFMKSLDKEESTKGFGKSVEDGEKALGAELTTIFDALGDEGAIAAVAKSGYRYQVGATPSFDDLAVVYVQKLKDKAAAKKLVDTLKQKIAGGPVKITGSGDDLVAEGEKPIPRVELRFVDGALVVVAGPKELADSTYAAFGGKGSLDGDAAHAVAVSSLKAKHAVLWFDLGRIGDTALAALPQAKDQAQAMGVDLGAIQLTGDRRMTGALGITFSKEGKKLAYTVDSMNMPVVFGAAAAFGMQKKAMKGLSGRKDDDDDVKPAFGSGFAPAPAKATMTLTGGNGSLTAKDPNDKNKDTKDSAQAKAAATGGGDFPAICETMFERYDHCVYKAVSSAHRPGLIKGLRSSVTKQDPSFRPRMCQSMLEAAERTHPGCK
ncbi:MAG: hypothetical protein IPG50_17140 [Myxococcales bacterium]|nr:hypothetical protein [Myxococcales bacterium]